MRGTKVKELRAVYERLVRAHQIPAAKAVFRRIKKMYNAGQLRVS